MEKTFGYSMNADKTIGYGKYTRTKLNHNVYPYNGPRGNASAVLWQWVPNT
jgi:hypothetical protein